MNRLSSIILFFSIVFATSAQENGAVSLEVGGVGGFASISYSKQFKSLERFGFEYRLGFSALPIDKNNGIVIVLPTLVHMTYGEGKHFADVGLGHTLSVTTKGSLYSRIPTSFGYRFQTEKRAFYRIAYTPIVSYLFNFQWEHWAGITVGFNLGPK